MTEMEEIMKIYLEVEQRGQIEKKLEEQRWKTEKAADENAD